MCGICGSFSKEKLVELSQLNSERGNKAFSLTIFDNEFIIRKIIKKIGIFENKYIENEWGCYFILHIQSPTKITDITPDNIHPAKYENNYLWHNGMILDECLENKKKEINENIDWDTQILLKGITENGYSFLDNIEGSFACLLTLNNSLFIFRNQIVPLYIDDNLNISSTKFDNGKEIDFNRIYQLNFKKKQLNQINFFNNNHNPYSF